MVAVDVPLGREEVAQHPRCDDGREVVNVDARLCGSRALRFGPLLRDLHIPGKSCPTSGFGFRAFVVFKGLGV